MTDVEYQTRFRFPFSRAMPPKLAAKACAQHPAIVAFVMQFLHAANPRCFEATRLVGSLAAIAPKRLPDGDAALAWPPLHLEMTGPSPTIGPVGSRSVPVFDQLRSPAIRLVSVYHHSVEPNGQVGVPGSVEAMLAWRPPGRFESFPNIAKLLAWFAAPHPLRRIFLETDFRSRFEQAHSAMLRVA